MSGEPTLEDEQLATEHAVEYVKEWERQVEAVHTVKEMFPEEFEALLKLEVVEELIHDINDTGEGSGWWSEQMYIPKNGILFDYTFESMKEEIAKSVGLKMLSIIEKTESEAFSSECCQGACPACLDNGVCCQERKGE